MERQGAFDDCPATRRPFLNKVGGTESRFNPMVECRSQPEPKIKDMFTVHALRRLFSFIKLMWFYAT